MLINENVDRKCYEFPGAKQHSTAEYNIPLQVDFVNYEKAFDSIQYMAVFEALIAHDVQEKYINNIKESTPKERHK